MKIKVILADILEEKGMSRYELSKRTGIQYQIIDNYYKNRMLRYDGYVLARMCEVLGCDVGDLLRCVQDDEV